MISNKNSSHFTNSLTKEWAHHSLISNKSLSEYSSSIFLEIRFKRFAQTCKTKSSICLISFGFVENVVTQAIFSNRDKIQDHYRDYKETLYLRFRFTNPQTIKSKVFATIVRI